MQLYYVYDCWTRDRGRIHKGECPNCNHGRGFMVEPSGQNGKWHGPFRTRDTAQDFASGLRRTDMAACRKCAP